MYAYVNIIAINRHHVLRVQRTYNMCIRVTLRRVIRVYGDIVRTSVLRGRVERIRTMYFARSRDNARARNDNPKRYIIYIIIISARSNYALLVGSKWFFDYLLIIAVGPFNEQSCYTHHGNDITISILTVFTLRRDWSRGSWARATVFSNTPWLCTPYKI